MTCYVEWETDHAPDAAGEALIRRCLKTVLAMEGCPYEAQVEVVITDNAAIREANRTFRGIDAPTDVLSFPMIAYQKPADFSGLEEQAEEYFDPDSGELLLGDVMLSADKVKEQAEAYGHSLKREFAFLIVHSLLHLCGYDHMEEEERRQMEARQEAVMERLEILR